MKQYLLSVMKGKQSGLMAQLIICLFVPLSFIYRFGVFCHRNFYRMKGAFKADKPVIAIGNITLGGSGKTPLVVWLARTLQERKFKPAILIRGYMPKFANTSDEADMLNEQLPFMPVLVGESRVNNIKKAGRLLPVDVYICDDAFQHWPLYRDLNIVAIDASNPFGNGFLLPAGVLREGISSLARADVFILTKTDGVCDIKALSRKLKGVNPKALILESRYKSEEIVDVFDKKPYPTDFLYDKRVAAFCAIGDPLSFELSLKNSGAKLERLFTYMDHHSYRTGDIQQMVDYAKGGNIQVLVTTHKDAVKLSVFKTVFSGIKVVYIPIQLEITKGSDEFIQKVISVCGR